MRPSRWTPRPSARSAISSSISSPALLDSVPRRAGDTAASRRRAVREALGLHGPAARSRARIPAALLERDRAAAVRPFALQRAPAVLRLHHRVAGADRHPRRFPRVGAQPERRRLDAVAGGHRDRVADGALDRRADRLPVDCGGLLVSGGNMANFVCFFAARAAQAGWDVREAGHGHGRAACCACTVGRDAHVDSEGGRPVGPGHDGDPLDSDRRRICAWTSLRSRGQIEADRRSRRRAVPRRRHRRVGEHRRRRSAAARLPRSAASTASGSTSTARMAGFAAAVPDAPDDLRALARGRLGRGRSAQVAVCAARGRLRAGARRRGAARGVLPITRRTTTSRSGPRTTSTSVRRTPAASARSRSGSRCGRRAPRATAG